MRTLPPNLFGIPFGLAGLAAAWHYAGVRDLAPTAVGDALALLGAVAWATITVAYARSLRRPAALAEDLRHPIAGPFLSLVLIAPLVLVVTGVVPHAPDLGRALVDVLAVAIVVLGGWYTGQWIYAPIQPAQLHPGYFLPTVAGGLLAAAGAASVGQQRFAEVLLGYGLICWLILGSIILGRLLVGPPLPTPLLPTLAIEVAPAAVATQAYLAVRGEAIDPLVAVFAGYGLLMVLAQVRLLPVFGRLGFAPSFWAFTFSWAAVVTAGLHWLAILEPAGWRAWSYVLLGAVTLLIGAIAWRTAVAAARGQLLPAPAPPVAA
ncbi:tellurite resistance protein [Solirubrobacter pauli]|uniref:Tellurite resistance protein n=1 Tax=Solirubrobacter pauli TaxID=166793 RepID=A0A660L1H0_9ACTN|nr:TDT family transporter [Solirubrobacter pauli]RKQ87054.1 tellurite resistance protein [Solirubrobacter pauli]